MATLHPVSGIPESGEVSPPQNGASSKDFTLLGKTALNTFYVTSNTQGLTKSCMSVADYYHAEGVKGAGIGHHFNGCWSTFCTGLKGLHYTIQGVQKLSDAKDHTGQAIGASTLCVGVTSLARGAISVPQRTFQLMADFKKATPAMKTTAEKLTKTLNCLAVITFFAYAIRSVIQVWESFKLERVFKSITNESTPLERLEDSEKVSLVKQIQIRLKDGREAKVALGNGHGLNKSEQEALVFAARLERVMSKNLVEKISQFDSINHPEGASEIVKEMVATIHDKKVDMVRDSILFTLSMLLVVAEFFITGGVGLLVIFIVSMLVTIGFSYTDVQEYYKAVSENKAGKWDRIILAISTILLIAATISTAFFITALIPLIIFSVVGGVCVIIQLIAVCYHPKAKDGEEKHVRDESRDNEYGVDMDGAGD